MFNLLKDNHICELIAVVCSTCITDTIVYPFTTARIRLQMNNTGNRITKRSPFALLGRIVRNEGVNGIKVSYLRLLAYHTISMAIMYSLNTSMEAEIPVRDGLVKNVSSMTALVLVQPIIVAKVRYQARIYEPSFPIRDAFKTIYNKEGVHGLFRGVIPNCFRTLISHCFDSKIRLCIASFINSDIPWPIGIEKFVISTAMYSFMMTILMNPFDVTRNRYINDRNHEYKNAFHCFAKILRKEGPRALLRGFTPYYCSTFISNLILWYIYDYAKYILKTL